jgi:N-glycosidase YbiA
VHPGSPAGDFSVIDLDADFPIRADWDTARADVMLHALREKFAAEPLKQLLLGTELRPLIEASPSDSYWGCGRSGRGRNRLGQLLMQVRAELRSKAR